MWPYTLPTRSAAVLIPVLPSTQATYSSVGARPVIPARQATVSLPNSGMMKALSSPHPTRPSRRQPIQWQPTASTKRTTPLSISIPKESLSFEKTEYFEAGERSTGIRKSEFFTRPLTVKVEGSRKTGERYISVLWCKRPQKYPGALRCLWKKWRGIGSCS